MRPWRRHLVARRDGAVDRTLASWGCLGDWRLDDEGVDCRGTVDFLVSDFVFFLFVAVVIVIIVEAPANKDRAVPLGNVMYVKPVNQVDNCELNVVANDLFVELVSCHRSQLMLPNYAPLTLLFDNAGDKLNGIRAQATPSQTASLCSDALNVEVAGFSASSLPFPWFQRMLSRCAPVSSKERGAVGASTRCPVCCHERFVDVPELQLVVELSQSLNRPVRLHASSPLAPRSCAFTQPALSTWCHRCPRSACRRGCGSSRLIDPMVTELTVC